MIQQPKTLEINGKPFRCVCGRDNMFVRIETPNPLYHIYKCFACERVYEAS